MDLRSFFQEAIGHHLSELESAVGRLDTDEEATADARRVAHSLKGSGATFGFPEVSEAASIAETSADDELGHALGELIAILARVAEAPGETHILVVDDDPLIRTLLEVRLAAPGRMVTAVDGLQKAMVELERHPADLVVLDLFLPDGDGRDLLAELVSSSPDTSVVVTSASTSPDLRAVCMASGATEFIGKPFDPNNFTTIIDRILSRSESGTVSRNPLIEVYQDLRNNGEVAVAAILPELHGPGGLDSRQDSDIVDGILSALDGYLPPDVAIGRWSDLELVAFAPGSDTALAEQIDRARLRLRNLAPRTDGAVVTVSAGVENGHIGLSESFEIARRAASRAATAGGDRVVTSAAGHITNVLLAEDDPLTAALIVHRLEREQLSVTHCRDGVAALEAADSQAFGLVILDIQMPGLDGFGVLEALRKKRTYSDTPIVILTAVGSERDVVRGFDLGCDDYVLKPFSPAELTARLRRFTRS